MQTPPHKFFDLPKLPLPPAQSVHWGQLYGGSYALAIAQAAAAHSNLTLIITSSMQEALHLEQDLNFFCAPGISISLFPDWETLPYDVFSPHQDIIAQRLSLLYRLPRMRRDIVIVPVATLMQGLAPPEYINGNSLLLRRGEKLDLDAFRQQLAQSGYDAVSQVLQHGEYAVRGALLDIFPAGSELPFRVDLLDDEIDSIKRFDPQSQRSTDAVEEIQLLPAREFPLSAEGISLFRSRYRDRFSGNPQQSAVYRAISEGRAIGGCEYYLPLFHANCCSLFDYLPADSLVICTQGYAEQADTYWAQIQERYEQRRYDIERPLLAPEELFIQPAEVAHKLESCARIHIQSHELLPAVQHFNFLTQTLPPLELALHAEQPSNRLQAFINEFSGRILLLCESAGRRETLLELLRNAGITATVVADWVAWQTSNAKLALCIAPIESGFIYQNMAVIAEAQIYGRRAAQQRRRKKYDSRQHDALINNLTDLSIGAPVVHEEHGVGRYLGLQTLTVGGIAREFLTLEYADGDKLYVPVALLHLISRYSGASPEHAPLHKLGSEQWQRSKKKAAERIRDIAAELLDIHARRAAREGRALRLNPHELEAFTNLFPFEETPDQQTAIDAVLQDLQSTQPMDRVVCGDVGFGKTEVAMRAAFACAMQSRQVAILVPTTLLAQQHFQNFKDRFADWPLQIECLSRFSSRKAQTEAISRLVAGKIDIIIGTHKLLQKDIRFHDLGLVIIDEEHRFGVNHKEAMKKLRAEVDILTLTATPIPRTLNMALSGLRDLSIIATPPENRNAIKTFISEWNENLIHEACQRELKRGGQIYFVHNRIETIEKTAAKLQTIAPEARIAIAHGQLPERELESVMLDFYHQRYQILLCTTIIESGIDVPSANTIIIDRADRFGLAQLHQLRGRVGRSHHNAYAYLIIPPVNSITADARKRLEALESLEDLGAGFILASHDLEIRGAGELLGEDQSGQIHEIGYTLYMEMLERAVKALKSGQQPLLEQPLHNGTEIDLSAAALLPDNYIYDVHERLVLYKRIASAANHEHLHELQIELIDRFGLLPTAAKNLMALTELKLHTAGLGIRKIDAHAEGGRIEFSDHPHIDVSRMIQLIQNHPHTYIFDGKNKLRFKQNLPDVDARIRFLEQLFNSIRPAT